MDLADKLIAQNQAEEKKRANGFAPHHGIDETGLPVPNPVNADYVVMRIISNINITIIILFFMISPMYLYLATIYQKSKI